MLTMSDDDADVLAAMRAGASRVPAEGSPAGAGDQRRPRRRPRHRGVRLGVWRVGCCGCSRAPPPPGPTQRFPELSTREQEVLVQLADGLTNQQIADVLVISPITVRNHVSSILAKLQVTDRRQAMLRARSPR